MLFSYACTANPPPVRPGGGFELAGRPRGKGALGRKNERVSRWLTNSCENTVKMEMR